MHRPRIFDERGVVKLSPDIKVPKKKIKERKESKLKADSEVCIGCTKEYCKGTEGCVRKRKIELEKLNKK